MREENFRVILDEAQDTDPAQFSVLTEITRPVEASGRWLEIDLGAAARPTSAWSAISSSRSIAPRGPE